MMTKKPLTNKEWVSKRKIIAAGIIGNILEYYDFALIGFLAVIMGNLFFPSHDPFLSLLGAFGAFAAGMIMRPIGALIFGHIGDRIGRRFALMSSLIMMAFPTFLIGFLPTYNQVGMAAPILLLLLRMIQGLSVGGEYASSIVYLVEQSPQKHQNLYGSFVSVGAKIGMAIGSGFCGILLWYIGDEAMAEWGWRIPFWSSIIIASAGLYLRRNLTDDYIPNEDRTIPSVAILKYHRKEFLQFLTIASSIWIFYYTVFIYLPIWLEWNAGLSKVQAGQINTISIAAAIILIPGMAIIADKIGALHLMKITSILVVGMVFPLFYGMSVGGYWGALVGTIGLVLLLCSFQAPIFASTVNALSHHGYRASFTALILGSAAGIVGGVTPALMTTLTEISGDPFAPAFVIIITSAIGSVAVRSVHLNLIKNDFLR